jgi:pimeloyl-ACP methyl ester carboxylesterase
MSLPLVLMPGLMCDAALWTAQRWAFAKERQVLVADHSCGASINQIARMLLSAAPDRFALAGLSMGGYIALEVCRLASERVDRLALLNTNAHDDPDENKLRRSKTAARAQAGGFPEIVEDLLIALVHPDHVARPEVADTHRSMAYRTGVEAFVRQQQAIIGRRDQQSLLPTLAMPALVLCGADDKLTPPIKHQEMAAALPNAVLEIILNCGHLSTLEQPEAVTHAMRSWLHK